MENFCRRTERLAQLREIQVGAINHPSSHLADVYREMGDLFAVELKPHGEAKGPDEGSTQGFPVKLENGRVCHNPMAQEAVA